MASLAPSAARPIASIATVLTLSFLLAGCNRASPGCAKDSDCKGDRVCVSGECRASSTTVVPAGAPTSLTQVVPKKSTTEAELRRAAVKLKDPKKGPAVVRKSASFDAAPVGTLFDGTKVGVVRESEDAFWAYCRYPYPDGSSEGWIHKDILSFD